MKRTLQIIILIFISQFSYGQLDVSGTEIVDGSGNPFLVRGVSLGGWMVQEGATMHTAGVVPSQHELQQEIEELIGLEATEQFYEDWRTNYVQKADIDYLKAQGFNLVRIPLHYNLFTLSVQDEPVAGENTWLDTGFNLTDQVIQWCAENQIHVIIEMQAAPGGQTLDENSDYNNAFPSFWEDAANRDKTTALWQLIAERYADEPWVAGYDLLKEPAHGGETLLNVYEAFTNAIRTEDTDKIIFVQGMDGDDFTGLTTPWDSKTVYVPHRKELLNNEETVQQYLDLRTTTGSPVYIGETRLNSNTWYAEMIGLLESNDLGWAIWPLKQVDIAAGVMSTNPYINFTRIINYWKGNVNPPSENVAKNIFNGLAEGLRFSAIQKHPDVLDALFRLPFSDTAVPFKVQNIPGVVYTTDYDMGPVGVAYFDVDNENLIESSGVASGWNTGTFYRNDGVDVEVSSDDTFTNGYNLGFLNNGEWVQMSVNVAEDALYDIQVRVASTEEDGKFYLSTESAHLSVEIEVPFTDGWQNWTTVTIEDVPLSTTDKKLRFHVVRNGFNVGSLTFSKSGESTAVNADYRYSTALDYKTIRLDFTKPMEGPVATTDFQITEEFDPITISDATLSSNGRSAILTLAEEFDPMATIRLSHAGSDLKAQDGTDLVNFSNKFVYVNVPNPVLIPAQIEAEDYYYASGIELEDTDDGQGQNIGWLSTNDYSDYYIEIPQAGIYTAFFRTAAESATGVLKVDIATPGGEFKTLGIVSFAPTGGWQNFKTTQTFFDLPQGVYQMRFSVLSPDFNLNWFRFESGIVTSNEELLSELKVSVFPNPAASTVIVQGRKNVPQDIMISMIDLQGKVISARTLENATSFAETFDTNGLAPGIYLIRVEGELGEVSTSKLAVKR